MIFFIVLSAFLASPWPIVKAQTDAAAIVVASTTSTQDSGLFGYILPIFRTRTGIEVRVVAQGTGQALDTARRGDADVVLVHATAEEQRFVSEGFGVERFDVMYNDFILLGAAGDPAHVRGSQNISQALQTIYRLKAPFVSRGDKSGTHLAELQLWSAAGINIGAVREPWYRQIGQGMGAALAMAEAMGAYVLSDRSTFVARQNHDALSIVVEGDQQLFNQYGIILVNPAKYPHVKSELGQKFIEWMIGPEGQSAIASYRISGQQLFFPNAKLTR
jgi:tungstate transport system substrate-binding protein